MVQQKPLVIFKCKRISKDAIPPVLLCIFILVGGWMKLGWSCGLDECGVQDPVDFWKEEVLKSLIHLQLTWCHISGKIPEEQNTNICVTPGGLTSQLQALHVCLNKPFKQGMHMRWTEWLMDKDNYLILFVESLDIKPRRSTCIISPRASKAIRYFVLFELSGPHDCYCPIHSASCFIIWLANILANRPSSEPRRPAYYQLTE